MKRYKALMTTSRYIVINADDFGYSPERDAGILDCYHDNSISSVSLMVNGCHAKEAVEKAKICGLPMALHLNLTEGSPVCEVPHSTLVGSDGYLLGKHGVRRAMAAGNIRLSEIQREIESQIDKFERLTGRVPVCVDGHQHVHVIPGVCETFAAVLKEKGIKITRLPLEDDHTVLSQGPTSNTSEFLQELQLHSFKAREIFHHHGLRFPGFSGLYTMGKDMSLDNLQISIQKAFENQSENYMCNNDQSTSSESNWNPSDFVVELMVHPGNRTGNHGGCGNGPDDFAKSEEREHEMKILCDPKMKEFYSEKNINLTSFSNILGK